MKKKVILLFFTASILATGIFGCGSKEQNNSKDNVTEQNMTATEEMTGTESLMEDTENTTSQLNLGNAVEIPQGWEGKLAETNAHGNLEKVIAEYCNVAETDYSKVRYYYNYVDLNGDSKDEILALVLGNDVQGINGNVLLWIENSDNLTKDSVKQAFSNVSAPVYISNHMTEGYRDLIVPVMNDETQNTATEGTDAAAAGTNTRAIDNNTTTANGATTKSGTANTDNAAADNTGTDNTNGTNPEAINETTNNAATFTAQKYKLLVWTGEKYQDVGEGKVVENLEEYEGTAILTNNMETDFANDNYHFIGEAMP